MTRKTYLTTAFDREKAAISLPADAFSDMKSRITSLLYKFQMGTCHLSDYQEPFVRALNRDLERIDSQKSGEIEIWMEYSTLEELYHLVHNCNIIVQAEFQDVMREYEHLRQPV